MLNERDYLKVLRQVKDLRQRVSDLERLEAATTKSPVLAVPLTTATILSFPHIRGFFPPSGVWRDGSDLYLVNYANPGVSTARYMKLVGSTPAVTYGTPGRVPILLLGGSMYGVSDDAPIWEVSGTEADVQTRDKGLTVFAWVKFANTASGDEYVFSKKMQTTNISYAISRNSSGYIVFEVSGDGTAVNSEAVTSSPDSVGSGKWALVCGRFDPGVGITLDVNTEQYTNAFASPSSLYNGTAQAMIGARDDSTTPGQDSIDGELAFITVVGQLLDDTMVTNLYNLSRYSFQQSSLWTP